MNIPGYICFSVSIHVNNVFNRHYFADAWLWRAYFKQEDAFYNSIGIYPQSPASWMMKVTWKF